MSLDETLTLMKKILAPAMVFLGILLIITLFHAVITKSDGGPSYNDVAFFSGGAIVLILWGLYWGRAELGWFRSRK